MLNRPTLAFQLFYFYIRQGGYVSALVCLSVSRLTQKPVDERQWNFFGRRGRYDWQQLKIHVFDGDLDKDADTGISKVIYAIAG